MCKDWEQLVEGIEIRLEETRMSFRMTNDDGSRVVVTLEQKEWRPMFEHLQNNTPCPCDCGGSIATFVFEEYEEYMTGVLVCDVCAQRFRVDSDKSLIPVHPPGPFN